MTIPTLADMRAAALNEPCASCGNHLFTAWATTWLEWLCIDCRNWRTERELNDTRAAHPPLPSRLPAPKGELGGAHP